MVLYFENLDRNEVSTKERNITYYSKSTIRTRKLLSRHYMALKPNLYKMHLMFAHFCVSPLHNL